MSDDLNRSITIQIRVEWKTPRGQLNDEDTDAVYHAVQSRIEQCLAHNICNQVGMVPGTAKMELLYGTVI